MKQRAFPNWAFPIITFSLILSGGLSVWLGPYLLSKSIPPQEREQVETYTRNIWIESLKASGGLAFVFTAYFAWRNLKAAEDKQITDRFSKAVEQIGSEVPAVQIGGIYCLQRLAEDSLDRDYFIVIDVLLELIRESSQAPQVNNIKLQQEFYAKDANNSQAQKLKPVSTNRVCQTALNSLSHLKQIQTAKTQEYRLNNINLWGADLQSLNLRSTNFSESILSQVNARAANLSNSNFRGAILCPGPTPSFIEFGETDIGSTWLQDTNFRDSEFAWSNVSRVIFDGSDLQGASFDSAYGKKACFRSCNLTNANFNEADLTKANFHNANLKEASFQGASISGANFTGVSNLTITQIQAANNWETATLPDYLKVKDILDQ